MSFKEKFITFAKTDVGAVIIAIGCLLVIGIIDLVLMYFVTGTFTLFA